MKIEKSTWSAKEGKIEVYYSCFVGKAEVRLPKGTPSAWTDGLIRWAEENAPDWTPDLGVVLLEMPVSVPDGLFSVEAADTPSTGYQGGTGYGWLGYVAGEFRPATLDDWLSGCALTRAEAEAIHHQQKLRERANRHAFLAYMNA